MIDGNSSVGIIHTEPVDSVHGDASSLDSTAYIQQTDRLKVLAVLISEERLQNESNMDVPETHITVQKTAAKYVGEIKLPTL